MKKEYSKDEILKSFKNAPPAVREMLSGEELSEMLYNLSKENSLSKENMILVAESNRNLLLGLTSPAEVLGNFIFAGIPAEEAQKILEELNQKIFIPTHKKMLLKETTIEHKQIATNISDNKKIEQNAPVISTKIQNTQLSEILKTNTQRPEPKVQIEQHTSEPQKEKLVIEPKEVKKPEIKTIERKHVVDPYRESF